MAKPNKASRPDDEDTGTTDGLPSEPPAPDEQARILDALRRWSARCKPVTAETSRTESHHLETGPPHNDIAGWVARLGEATGSASPSFALRQLSHLGMMVTSGNPNPDRAVNSMLAAVAAVEPVNEVEGQRRPHSALGGKPPISQLTKDNLLGNDT